jgi:YD repeat-containing protein
MRALANRVETYRAPGSGDGSAVTRYSYDLNGRMQSVEHPDGEAVETQYDGAGRLSAVISPRGTTSFAYSTTTGLLRTISGPAGVNLAYTYDGDLETGTTWSGAVAGTVTRSYDTSFRIASESVGGSIAINFTYDDDDLPLTVGAMTLAYDPQTGLLSTTVLGSVNDERTYDI